MENVKYFFDGAFGTYYALKSGKNEFCEHANLNDQATVIKIHQEYIEAGARALRTNTFGVNTQLTQDWDEITRLITQGYTLAKEAARGTEATVFADIGYINSEDEAVSGEYIRLADIFIGCGAKYFIFETLAEFEPVRAAVEHIKACVQDATVIISFAVSQDGYTKKGHYYKDLLNAAVQDQNVDIRGLNCICGPNHLYNLLKVLDLSDGEYSAMPNSGYPSSENGRTVFRDNAEYFSQKLQDIFSLGVHTIGGCCGTTPEHIRLSAMRIASGEVRLTPNMAAQPAGGQKEQRNVFKEKLLAGGKVIAVELDPPDDADITYLLNASKKAKNCGADVITLTDSPLARTRADSMISAAKVKREIGIETMPHLSCRDRNHIGIKAALMGAHMEDIANILAVTGDPIAQTDRGSYKGVFNFSSFDLISFIHSLNAGIFSKSPIFIGGALNVNALQFDVELRRAERKIAQGVQFFLTQPLFDERAIGNFIRAKKELNAKILAGILPVAGYRNAMFLNNEVAGINIPPELIEDLKDKTPEQAIQVSADYSMNIIEQIAQACDGYYIMTPLKKIDLVCELISRIRSFV